MLTKFGWLREVMWDKSLTLACGVDVIDQDEATKRHIYVVET